MLETTLESLLNSKDTKPVNLKGNQSWIFIGRTDAEAETPVHWPLDANNWLIGKDAGAGKDWRQEEKGMTEDEMVGWHLCLNGYEFEQVLGDDEGQGSLVCCSQWGHKELHMIGWLCGSQKLWKILKEIGIPDHLTCLVRNLYAGQEATVRTGYGTTDWF